MKRIIILLVCCFTLLFFCVSCADKNELGDIAVAVGIAIDVGNNNDILLSVELVNRNDMTEPGKSAVFSVEAADLQKASEDIRRKLDRHIFWGNVMLVVFDSSMDSEQIFALSKELYKSNRFNDDLPLIQSETKAKDILEADFGEAQYVSQGLSETIDRVENKTHKLTISDYLELVILGENCQLPKVRLTQNGMVELEGEDV